MTWAAVVGQREKLPGSVTPSGAEIYDPASGVWTGTSLANGTFSNVAELKLPDGVVLVTGGASEDDNTNDTVPIAEIYDPSADTWTVTDPMNEMRIHHTLPLLPSGQVIAIDGFPTIDNEIAAQFSEDPENGPPSHPPEENHIPAVGLHNLSKAFGKVKALEGVSMDIPIGSIFGLLGPNGSGKTTLLSVLCGFLKPHPENSDSSADQ